MYEKLDVYDENRNKTGRILERKEGAFKGEGRADYGTEINYI